MKGSKRHAQDLYFNAKRRGEEHSLLLGISCSVVGFHALSSLADINYQTLLFHNA